MESFADVPVEVERRVRAGERVALVLLDALGLTFLDRLADHPLVAALDVTPLRTQFPSTTTAHVTTLHWGLPVEQHGLYEWNLYEPTLDQIIVPLMFTPSGSWTPGELLGRLDPAALSPGRNLYERLAADGISSVAFGPERIARSPYTALAVAGSDARAYREIEDGAAALGEELRRPGGAAYTHLYWDQIDAAGHEFGPSSDEFERAARRALDALWASLQGVPDEVAVLFCADHGQVDVSPSRVDYLDEEWPALAEHLTHAHPAGSSRDVFLHVRAESVALVIDELATRLGDRAEVRPAAELFGPAGPRLTERLADVAVLPAAGRQAWLRRWPGVEQKFLGHHGGLDPAETSTYLARLAT